MTDVDVLEDVEAFFLNCFALGAENNETNISKRKNVQKRIPERLGTSITDKDVFEDCDARLLDCFAGSPEHNYTDISK